MTAPPATRDSIPSSPMIDRVAKSLGEAHARWTPEMGPWGVFLAVAALNAMREPGHDPKPIAFRPLGMTRAGADAMWVATERGKHIGLEEAAAVWRAMVAAALGEAGVMP